MPNGKTSRSANPVQEADGHTITHMPPLSDPLETHRAQLAEQFIVGLAATGKASLAEIAGTEAGPAALSRLERFFKGQG